MSVSGKVKNLNWPLMMGNISQKDLIHVANFLKPNPRLTQGAQVKAFEKEWSDWAGVKHSVFVNSGSSANLITLAALKEYLGASEGDEIIVPTLTWVSDIAAVLQNGFKPVFVDIDPCTFGMDEIEVFRKITSRTKAVFLTHILGFNALTDELLKELSKRKIPFIEDACESHGATFKNKRVGAHGLVSNFSFYYAHHLSTIEGGMVCTNDEKLYQMLRMFRSHGLVREATSEEMKRGYESNHQDLNPEFIFAFPAYNVRSTEINAVIGRRRLKSLDAEIKKRNQNFYLFLKHLDGSKYHTDFNTEGCSNYALTLVLQEAFKTRLDKVTHMLNELGVEFRRGLSGGGNQLRQPYLKKLFGDEYKNYPQTEHVHFHGLYIGNYPDLKERKILELCEALNEID
jgi:CDP-4-dehydro-6-deoxyglucose reductase, E1